MAKEKTDQKEDFKLAMYIVGLIIGFCIIACISPEIALAVYLIGFIAYEIYVYAYYNSSSFLSIKERIKDYIKDCNQLNDHIESLKNTDVIFNQRVYGTSDYHDSSSWNYQRPEFSKVSQDENVYNCSRSVCDNSRKRPIKYVCKYFDINADEETLQQFETILTNFEAAERGKKHLLHEKNEILTSVSQEVPFLIKTFSLKKLSKKLGFKKINLSTAHYPRYIFRYVSSGGNASTENIVTMNIKNLNELIEYLNDKIKWKKSIAGQRALMTSKLRKEILKRDDYTCAKCGANMYDEPHLLLEIDHIIPISKGGLTTKDNLQTLCWRCNRSKGAKIE